jgi:4-amino-4-deoxy-L-arabinose transferase-like glycosyltransferase
MNALTPRPRWPGRRTEAIALLLILLVAAAFRLYRLDDIPPGLTHDEADHGLDAVAILHGARPIYETVGYGREPLYDYVVAALMPIFGPHYLTLRLTSALAGLLLIVVAHFWVRRAFDVPIALLTSALLAVSFWAISTDRQALRSALLPALFTASIFFAWRALRPHRLSALTSAALLQGPPSGAVHTSARYRWFNYGMAGVFFGLSLYTYMAARVLPGVFALLWLYLLIFHRAEWKKHWAGLIAAVVLGVVLALPMFTYLSANPESEARLTQLSGPIDRLFAGDPSEVLSNALGALGMFTLKGDNLWLYNIPGRPLLDGVTGALFYLGLIVALIRLRRIEYALAICWLLLGVFPSLLTGVVASSLRSIAAQPVVYLFAAIGAVEFVRRIDRLVYSRVVRSLPLGALIVAVTISTARDYFGEWAQARDVRVAYHTTLFEIAHYLDREAKPGSVAAISSIYPNRFHDPAAMEMILRREDLALSWFTGSFVDMTGAPHASLIFPQVNLAQVAEPAQGLPIVIVQSIAPIDPIFASAFERHAERIDSIQLRADDFNPGFDVYRFDSAGALSDLLSAATAPTQTLDFGHTLDLIGYAVRTPQVRSGQTVEVVTYWRVTSPFEREANVFTHALSGDPSRPVLAQQDSLDAPAGYWTPGDAFAQVHRFVIPADATPGSYPLEVGVYTREDGARLPLYDAVGSVAGDHVIIGAVEVLTP